MAYELTDILKLRPLEKVFPNHLANIKQLIQRDGAIHKALIADRASGTVLDGSHRYAFLLAEGYGLAPVHWVDYQNENIRVGSRLAHRFLVGDDSPVNKRECLRRSACGELFPPRTTRHFFPFRKSDIVAPLSDLMSGMKRSIDHLLADVDVVDEIAHNRKFLAEIDEELRTLSDYIAEMVESRTYLTTQVEMLNAALPVAFFPGKFHPPHMGHVQTILKIAPHYRKVIVAVTGDTPSDGIMTQAEIIEVLHDVLANVSNIDVVGVAGTLIMKSDARELPTFDVLLSGNPAVIDWAEKIGIRSEYVGRSLSAYCSGEVMRTMLRDEPGKR